MRARTIIRNKEKLKGVEVKEKETKLTKDSSGKIQEIPAQTIQIRINKRGALKLKC